MEDSEDNEVVHMCNDGWSNKDNSIKKIVLVFGFSGDIKFFFKKQGRGSCNMTFWQVIRYMLH